MSRGAFSDRYFPINFRLGVHFYKGCRASFALLENATPERRDARTTRTRDAAALEVRMQPVAAAAATPQQQQHALLFKPDGVLSQFVQNEQALCHRSHLLLSDLQSTASLPVGTMAIGRLDQDSEGLLLLTTDGRLLPRCVDSSCWCGHSLGAAAEHPWLRAASDGPSRVPSAPRTDYRCSCPAHAALLYPPPGATMSQRAGR